MMIPGARNTFYNIAELGAMLRLQGYDIGHDTCKHPIADYRLTEFRETLAALRREEARLEEIIASYEAKPYTFPGLLGAYQSDAPAQAPSLSIAAE